LWRIGILSGTGTARKRTIPALLGSEICQVSVVHGRSDARLKQVTRLDPEIHLVSSEQDFAELRDRYDVIYIGSPPFLHLPHIELAVQLGMPIICEKPLVTQRDQLEPLLELIADSKIPFMVAHHVRHQPAMRDIMNFINTTELESPITASLQWCFRMDHSAPNARWKLDPLLGGSNAMFDSGVHAVDLAVCLFGAPDRVGAVGHRLRSAVVLDCVVALLDYSSFSVTVVASQSASRGGNDLRITFPTSVLRAEGLLGEKSLPAIEIVGESGTKKVTYEPVNLYRAEVENFCQSFGSSNAVGTTAADATVTTRILFAIEDALRTGGLVNL
jgi:predicted dehydrogenase